MIELSGEVKIYLNSLGKKEGNKNILEAMVLPGSSFSMESMEIEGVQYSSYQFLEHGVAFSFTDKLLDTIFIFMTANEEYSKYLLGDRLFDNIEHYSNRSDIIEELGFPDIESKQYIKYFLNDNKYIHFEFNNNNILSLITLGCVDE